MLVREINDKLVSPYSTQYAARIIESTVIASLVIPEALGVPYSRALAEDGAAIFGTRAALLEVFGPECFIPDDVMRDLGVNPETKDPIGALQEGLLSDVVDEIHLPEGWRTWFDDSYRLSTVLEQARRGRTLILEVPSMEGCSGAREYNE